MEPITIVALFVALAIGLLIGYVVAHRVAVAREQTLVANAQQEEADERTAAAEARREAAEAATALAEARREAADAREAAASARESAADARAETHEVRGQHADSRLEVEAARSASAEARREAAEARQREAEVRSQLAEARVERDGALDRAEQLTKDREALVNEFKVLSGETLERQGRSADATAEARLKRTEEVVKPLAELLEQYQNRLTQVEKERVSMSTQLRDQVQAVQSTGEHLRRETHALATALRKPQVRGAWGEMQLRRVAEYAGMVERCDFDTQTTTTTSADRTIRPDMRVNLTNGNKVFVDAKVPLSAFLEAHEATDDATRERKLKDFGKNVRTHVDQLSAKEYWKADAGTPEFVVLFLPNEAFLFAALEQQPDLHEYAATRNIVIATPNTLIAMLRSIAYGWKQVALARDAAKVLELGRELHARLVTMGKHVDQTGRALTRATKAYNQMVGSLETRVMVAARRFNDLEVSDAELEEVSTVDDMTRQLTHEELVADAASVTPMIGRRAEIESREDQLPEQQHLSRSEPDWDTPDSDPDIDALIHPPRITRRDGRHGLG